MTKTPKEKWPGAGRVAFLAQAQTVRESVEAGYPVLFIYRQLEAKLGISYSQFARYVVRYIRSPTRHEQTGTRSPTQLDTPPAPRVEEPATQAARKGKVTKPARRAFKHKATSGRDRDDLI